MRKLFCVIFIIISCSCSKDIETYKYETSSNSNHNQSSITSEDIAISSNQAAFVANTFLNHQLNSKTKNTNQQKVINSIHTIIDKSKNPLMYVVNFNTKGFAIISATKRHNPILAYSETSNFNHNDVTRHLGITDWIDNTTYSIENAENLSELEKAKIRNAWKAYEKSEIDTIPETKSYNYAGEAFHNRLTQIREENPGYNFYSLSRVNSSMFPTTTTYDEICSLANNYNSPVEYTIVGIKDNYRETKIGPLLTSKWGQNNGYNELIPNKPEAGCVAIAAAQIIRFHRYPNIYDWNNMLDYIPTYETQRFIYDVGRAVNTDYSNSSSTINKAQDAFDKTYGYNATIKSHNHLNVFQELKTYKRPVYMRGAYTAPTPDQGHAWVCDGVWEMYNSVNTIVEFMFGFDGNYYFSDDGNYFGESGYALMFFSMNWGWEGGSDGWYIHNNSSKPIDDYRDFSNGRKDMFISIK